jgi:hypothetical protein
MVLACGSTALLLSYLFQRKCQNGTIPAVPGYLVIGNLFDMMPSTLLSSLNRYQKQFGHIFTLRVLNRKFLHISDAHLCREVLLKRPRMFVRALDDMALRFKYLPYGQRRSDLGAGAQNCLPGVFQAQRDEHVEGSAGGV